MAGRAPASNEPRNYAGPVGQPRYREIKPGLYEYVASIAPAPAPQVFTREQLIRQ